jgi:hypothetical protein
MEARILDGALPFPTLSDGALEMLALINPMGCLKALLRVHPAQERLFWRGKAVEGGAPGPFYLAWEDLGRLVRLQNGGLGALTTLRDLSRLRLWAEHPSSHARAASVRLGWGSLAEWLDACDKGRCPFPARELAMEIRPEIQGYPPMIFWSRWEEPARQADAGDALLAWVGVKPRQRFADGSTGKQRAALVGAALIRLPEVVPPHPAVPDAPDGILSGNSPEENP